eukprot:jgi/Botrbrau1/2387/Bobra.0395s0019.1
MVTPTDARTLMRLCDIDRDGYVTLKDFLEIARLWLSNTPQDASNNTMDGSPYPRSGVGGKSMLNLSKISAGLPALV